MEDKAQASAEAASVEGKRLSAEAMTGGSGRWREKLSMVHRQGGGYGTSEE